MKNQLTTLRDKTGWTADELADFVGVSTACIKAIENGSYDPSLFMAYDIAEALDARVTELFPPVPRRERLEELAAKPWYVRLFFEFPMRTQERTISAVTPRPRPNLTAPRLLFIFDCAFGFRHSPHAQVFATNDKLQGSGEPSAFTGFPLPAGGTRGRSLEDQNQARRREGHQWSQIHFS